VVRGKKVRTTVPDRDGYRDGDLVNRDFSAPVPNRCWVADFTSAQTWSGTVYVAVVYVVYSGGSGHSNPARPVPLADLTGHRRLVIPLPVPRVPAWHVMSALALDCHDRMLA
jgi:transposase InsO family protein